MQTKKTLFKSKLLFRKSKLKLYCPAIRPTVVYDCETWVLTESTTLRLSVFERKIIRKIFGPTKGHNVTWRTETNKELDELIKHRNVTNYVKSERLSWFGYLNIMPETSIVRKIYKWKPFTSRPVGRPKPRWEDDNRNYLKNVKIIKWTEQIQNRLQLKDIVEKAKTTSELQRRRR
jgi:hypothetical protein